MLIYNVYLEDYQKKIKSMNRPKYVVVKASMELMHKKLAKTTIAVNFRQLYLPMFSLSH